MLVKTLVRHPQGMDYRNPGEVYDCPEEKARLLRVLGKVEIQSEASPEPVPTQTVPKPPLPITTPESLMGPLQTKTADADAELLVTKAAQTILDDAGIDPATITGTGVNGTVTKKDAEAAVS